MLRDEIKKRSKENSKEIKNNQNNEGRNWNKKKWKSTFNFG
jgi:hypothetical protein